MQGSKLRDAPRHKHKIYSLPPPVPAVPRLITHAPSHLQDTCLFTLSRENGWKATGTGAYPPSSTAEVDQSRKRRRFPDSGSTSGTALGEPFLRWLFLGRVSLFEGSKCCLCSLFHRLLQPPPPWSEQRETGLNRN